MTTGPTGVPRRAWRRGDLRRPPRRVLGLRARADGRRPARRWTGCSRPARHAARRRGGPARRARRDPRRSAAAAAAHPPARIVEVHVRAVDDDARPGRRRDRARPRWPRPADPALGAARRRLAGHRRPRRVPATGARHPDLAGRRRPAPRRLARSGPLAGETVAVKDLFAVAGQRVGAGNPAWLADAHRPRPRTPRRSRPLLDAGAAVRGIARTDEFAYSLAGTNAPPRHPAEPARARPHPRRLLVRLGRRGRARAREDRARHRHRRLDPGAGGVPGPLRDPHDARRRRPIGPAPSGADLRHRRLADPRRRPAAPGRRGAAAAGVAGRHGPAGRRTRAAPAGRARRRRRGHRLAAGAQKKVETWALDELPGWLQAFQTLQAWEAWQSHGAWLDERMDTLGPDVRGRFERARDGHRRRGGGGCGRRTDGAGADPRLRRRPGAGAAVGADGRAAARPRPPRPPPAGAAGDHAA